MLNNIDVEFCKSNLNEGNALFTVLKMASFICLLVSILFVSDKVFAIEQQDSAIDPGYRAQIQRTAHNVAHITAKDLPSAWFGQGYAMAEDRICTVLDQVIKVRSQRAQFFGPGISNANIDSDFGYLHLGVVAKARRKWQALPENIQQMLSAHAAGINAYIAKTGPEALPELCRNANWLVKVTAIDLLAYSMDFGLTSFSKSLLTQISNSSPPGTKIGSNKTNTIEATPIVPKKDISIGSNGWGLGSDLTESGNGILLANPHFPWEGELKLWESHITVPGEIDVYGVTLPGIPNVLVGFNKAVAWTLAVSSATHETFYKLKLIPELPTKYLYDGEVRSMEAIEYNIQVLDTATGVIEQLSRTLWRSHYGPVLSLAPFITWNNETALSYRDANLDNSTYLSQFFDMSQASDLNDFIKAHEQSAGIPFGHTIASSIGGDAWYADGSPVPNLSPETYAVWQQNVKSDTTVSSLWRVGFYTLDGSTSRDEWVTSTESSAPGLLPFVDKPQLRRRDFVFNSNDNHWLSNPESPLEGLDPLYGSERTPRSLRTRANFDTLIQGRGVNGKFTLEKLQQASLSNQSLTGKLLRGELVNRCKETSVVQIGEKSVDLTKACEVLAKWDETFDLDSKGAVLFREFLGTFNPVSDFSDAGALFDEPFDPENPIATPKGLAVATGAGEDTVLLRLAEAIQRLIGAGFSINSTLKDMQYSLKGEARIPVHGGNEQEGILNITDYNSGESSSLFPIMDRGKVLNQKTGLTEDGYIVNSGTSFLMAVELSKTGPQCQAIMTNSQSGDLNSPFFADQTQLFSDKKWHQCLFDQQAIVADPQLKTYSVHDLTGDIDKDGDVDRADVMLVHFVRNVPLKEGTERYDLNKDGEISAADVSRVTELCSYPQCAIN